MRRLIERFTADLASLISRRHAIGAIPPKIVETLNPQPLVNDHVLVLVPASPRLHKSLVESAVRLAQRAVQPFRSARIVVDTGGLPPSRGLPHPYRQAALAKIRQDMVDTYLRDEDWLFWVDADIVDYPADLLNQLIRRSGGGIGAPVVLMDGRVGDGPLNQDGFGPGRFFDVAGFVENMRWARFDPPWFDQAGPVFELDSVGACYLANASIYRSGARHEADPYSLQFIAQKLEWLPGTVATNQSRSPAGCFTEHFSVCQWAKRHGYPVRAFGDLIARHLRV